VSVGIAYARGPILAAAYRATGRVLMQRRRPAALVVDNRDYVDTIYLPAEEALDPGNDLFHVFTPSGIACASCHPEGGDDGHVWDFAMTRRRTQPLLGGLLGTAPFHWSGDQPDMGAIMTSALEERMGARGTVTPSSVAEMSAWLDSLPAPRGLTRDSEVVARGRVLFEDATVGCAGCHSGPQLTDSRTVDVGTGAAFQVPSLLGVAHRAPWLHDGCATTLEAVLDGTCQAAGAPVGAHGDVSGLDASALADLIAYVESL
jgi:hypothetical protein